MNIQQTSHLLDFYRLFHPKSKIVATSGFYNPIHKNHIRYLESARKLGDFHVAIVNGDESQIRKSNISFMDSDNRLAIVSSFEFVDLVCLWDEDTVDGALAILKPHIFAKGGDRSTRESLNEKELSVCDKYGIEIKFGVGGIDKNISSSAILNKYYESRKKIDKTIRDNN